MPLCAFCFNHQCYEQSLRFINFATDEPIGVGFNDAMIACHLIEVGRLVGIQDRFQEGGNLGSQALLGTKRLAAVNPL